MPNPFRWCRTRRRRLALILVVVPLVLLNAVAFMHARAFTRYAPGESADGYGREPLGGWQKARLLFTGVTVPRPENRYTPADWRLPFTTHTIASGGATLEAWHVPAEQPRGLMLLFHGYATCKASLLPEAAAFRAMGYASLLVDFRGSGGSSGSDTTIGAHEADDVAAAVAYAREQWPGRRLVLFGPSMGAAAILRAAARGGVGPDAVVLECPFDRLLTTVEHRFTMRGLPAFPFARLLLFWGGVQHGFDPFAHNPVEYAAGVRCPALLMHGARDRHVAPAEAEAVYAALAGPKRFALFAEAGHQPYCWEWPERWCEVVSGFLGEHVK
jgi:alpha-beta hydrolase superfamily lysophospholipase